MKKLIACIMIASLSLPSLAHAADAVTDAVISPLKKSQPAPFSGVLFNPRAAASVATEISTLSDRINLEVKKAVTETAAKKDFILNESTAQCTADKKTMQATSSASTDKIKLLEKDVKASRKAVKDAEDAAPSRTLWMSLGGVGGVLVTIAIVFGVNRASK